MDNFTLISLDLNPTTSYGLDGAALDTMYGVDGESVVAGNQHFMSDDKELEIYLRVTCLIFLFLIFTIGFVGNIMVTLVIGCSRDMRTSTNIFLINLSVADVLVLAICCPTAFIEIAHHPDRWILGYHLCKFIPLLEAIVANASVLTILAISYERFYAICKPLRANYICTKRRAVYISFAAWIVATIVTSPMILMINYKEGVNERGEWTARCEVLAGSFWSDAYTIGMIGLFFLVPCLILIGTYCIIANRLTMEVRPSCNAKNDSSYKARKQVVVMLGSVCFLFFLCLLPFRVLTLFVVLADHSVLSEHVEAFHNFLYFSRIMVYLNSAINPILYNVVSSKWRNGFLRLCYPNRKPSPFTRNGTSFLTNTTTTNSNNMSINLGHQSGLGISQNGKGGDNSPEVNVSLLRKNGGSRTDGKTLKNYLLSQPHSSGSANGFLISHRAPGILYNGIGTSGVGGGHSFYPIQKAPVSSFGANTANVKIPKQLDSSSPTPISKSTNNNHNSAGFPGTMSVKISSDVIYSAYIPGRRSETVL